MFYPKIHFEINPIEMLWGYIKYREYFVITFCYMTAWCSAIGFCAASNGKFVTAKILVPQCLNMADTLTIQQFFQNFWHYMDTYWYVSSPQCLLLLPNDFCETGKVLTHSKLPSLWRNTSCTAVLQGWQKSWMLLSFKHSVTRLVWCSNTT